MSDQLRLFTKRFSELVELTNNSTKLISNDEFDFNQLTNALDTLNNLYKSPKYLTNPSSSEESRLICNIKLGIEQLFTYVRSQEYLSDEFSYFIINLHLSEFIDTHYSNDLEQYYSILMKITIYDLIEIPLLWNLLEDALSSRPRAWLSTNILINTQKNIDLSATIDFSNPLYIYKFQKILKDNSDYTNIIYLMTLFCKLRLNQVYLDGLQPFEPMDRIKFIMKYNPSFKNLIHCSVTSKVVIFPDCSDCFIQPKESKLLILWMNVKREPSPYLINLHTLTRFNLSDSTITLNFQCQNERRTRSGKVSGLEYLKSYSILNPETNAIADIEFEVKLQQEQQVSWLVAYLNKATNKKTRKISINSIINVPESQIMPDSHEVPESLEGEVITSSIPQQSAATSTQENEGTLNVSQKRKASGTSVELEQVAPTESSKRPKLSTQIDSAENKLDQVEENVQANSTVEDLVECTSSPGSNVSLVATSKKANPVPFSTDQVETSTANNTILPQEFTDVNLNDTTSTTMDTAYDVMNEGLKLLSSNLINKLKQIEYNILKKQNQLQQELDYNFAKIEQQHKLKLQEIQQYYKQECEKLLK
ncbi:hypothetical protein JA1_003181 [Spathaspora sp. JA1]|nr:hypothetical protein JA1_003181 [Spathaspora sp. JA1]